MKNRKVIRLDQATAEWLDAHTVIFEVEEEDERQQSVE